MLGPADFAELERRTAALSTKNHFRLLADALACLRQRRDPVAVLELMMRMQGSPYAARDNEATALRDVIAWLEAELRGATRLTVDALELRLVWARRLATIHQQRPHDREAPRVRTTTPGPSRAPQRDATKGRMSASQKPPATDAVLRQLRQRYPEPPPLPEPPLPPRFTPRTPSLPPPSSGLPPTTSPGQKQPLPRALRALFENHRDAVTLLKRLTSPPKQGASTRLPGPIRLAQPTNGPAFPPGLGPVSLAPTSSGLAEYLKELQTRSGTAFPFYVSALEISGDRLIAHQLLLALPEEPVSG